MKTHIVINHSFTHTQTHHFPKLKHPKKKIISTTINQTIDSQPHTKTKRTSRLDMCAPICRYNANALQAHLPSASHTWVTILLSHSHALEMGIPYSQPSRLSQLLSDGGAIIACFDVLDCSVPVRFDYSVKKTTFSSYFDLITGARVLKIEAGFVCYSF